MSNILICDFFEFTDCRFNMVLIVIVVAGIAYIDVKFCCRSMPST